MDQHKLSREQWEERIQVWHAEHSGMLKWVFHVGPWAGHLTACLITLSLHFYNVVLLVCGFDSELPMWAYSWCVFFSSVLNHIVKHSRIFCTGAENSVASWRSWTCAHYIVIALSGKRSKGLSNLTVIEAFALTDGESSDPMPFLLTLPLRHCWEVNVADFLSGNTSSWDMGIFSLRACRYYIVTSKVNPKCWMFTFNFCVWSEL